MSQTVPKISVVIPLYNKEKYLRRAVESVLSQEPSVHEVIVVDDGSTDNGPAQLVQLEDARLRLIRQPNGGVSRARNTGIEAATGEFIAFLDADDAWLPGFVSELQALIQAFPQASLYATSYVRTWPDGRREGAGLPNLLKGAARQVVADPFSAWSRSAFFSISSSSCIRRTALFMQNIRFPEGESLGEDQDVIFRLLESGDLAFSTQQLSEYTQAVPNSLYSSLPKQLPGCYSRLLQRTQAEAYPSRHKRGALRVVAVNYLNVARTLMQDGKRGKAAALVFSRAAMRHPTYWIRTALRLLLPTGTTT